MLVCERLDLAGGVERFVCDLANHLAGTGHTVLVAAGTARWGALPYPLAPAVRCLSAGLPAANSPAGKGGLRRWHLARRQWELGRALAALAREARADVLVLNGLTTACAFLLAAPGLAPRAICCDHNHFDARSRPWRWLRAWLYRRVAAVVSLTEADRPRFAALNPRTTVIPNASSLRASAPAVVGAPHVLAVGRLVAQKGVDLLLAAWAEVVSDMPEARLSIVGDGPLRPALQQQATALAIDHAVKWCAPTTAIEAAFRAAAVFVLPSRYEGMPLALLEAQALGVPAVAFDCPTGPREILGEDTGLLVPPQDSAALAAALLRLLRDPALRARMGQAAIARSREHFSPARHFDAWATVVQRVAVQGAPQR